MNQNPTFKVLSSMREHGVRCLLMGGQACVFYGAAEFSRDVDFAILASPANFRRLQLALDHLQAHVIAIPSFKEAHLHKGLAVHFRCQAPGVEGLRIDVMTKMRGVDPFPALWERRTTLEIDHIEVDLMSLPDLVCAKKTQRAKDWPMIQRLIEAHWFNHRHEPTAQRIEFWLMECRTPEILVRLADTHQKEAEHLQTTRPVLTAALDQDLNALGEHLEKERLAEVEADRGYWQPLRRALEQIEQKSVENGEGANSTQYGMSLRSFSSLRDSITLRYLLFE